MERKKRKIEFKLIVEKTNTKNYLDGYGVSFGSRRKRVVGEGDDGRHFILVIGVVLLHLILVIGVLADHGE